MEAVKGLEESEARAKKEEILILLKACVHGYETNRCDELQCARWLTLAVIMLMDSGGHHR